MTDTIAAALCALGLALTHVFIGRLQFLDVVPRSRWLSFAGGISVAYVFLHILPELAHRQELVSHPAIESAVYMIALAGLASFYGLERAARVSRHRSRAATGDDKVEAHVFWLHIGSFGFYNVLIGYLLLHREEQGLASLGIFFIAMALHFVTNDFGLRDDHKDRYDHRGRWLLAAAVVVGWGLGMAVTVPAVAVDVLFAFLAGGVVLNVLKEELPEDRQSRFWPFAAGAGGYAVLLTL